MAGFMHAAVGIAAKPLSPKTPLPALIVAGMAVDLLCFALMAFGVEGGDKGALWSHGLFTSLIYAAVLGLIAGLAFKRLGAGIAVGLVSFSHWIVDVLSHPMIGGKESAISLFFASEATFGLGLYYYLPWALVLDLGSFVAALVFYLLWRKGQRAKLAAPA